MADSQNGRTAPIKELVRRAHSGLYYLTPEEAQRLGVYVRRLEGMAEHESKGLVRAIQSDLEQFGE